MDILESRPSSAKISHGTPKTEPGFLTTAEIFISAGLKLSTPLEVTRKPNEMSPFLKDRTMEYNSAWNYGVTVQKSYH